MSTQADTSCRNCTRLYNRTAKPRRFTQRIPKPRGTRDTKCDACYDLLDTQLVIVRWFGLAADWSY
jgi:hypothetical protein